MSSVIVTWKGRCEDQKVWQDLLADFGPIAWDNRHRWAEEQPMPRIVRQIARSRKAGPMPVYVKTFDQDVRGKIVMCSDIAEDGKALREELAGHGVACEDETGTSRHFLFRLQSVHLKGVEFRLFDPRELYPGEDRFSCVFLECLSMPFLDGYLVRASGPEWCRSVKKPQLAGIDWYIESPYLHLRRYYESWTVLVLSWMKFFYIPALSYVHDETLSGYDRHSRIFGMLEEKMGPRAARQRVVEELRRQFALEARRLVKDLASI